MRHSCLENRFARLRSLIVRAFICSFLGIITIAGPVWSQKTDAMPPDHDHSMHASMPGMDMSSSTPDWMPEAHASSGTGWQPAAAPSQVWMKSFHNWDVMAHGVIFLDYNQQGGPRGAGKA